MNKLLMCKENDIDVPGLECGHPLPCPRHTVIIDTEPNPPTITIPVTNKKALSKPYLIKLKKIGTLIRDN